MRSRVYLRSIIWLPELERLTLAEGFEVSEELGEADGGGFGSVDLGVAGGAEGGDGERHGNAVVRA